MTDDVIEGVRRAQEAFAGKHDNNVRQMVAALRKLNAAGDWPIAALTPLTPCRGQEGSPILNEVHSAISELLCD